MAEAAHKLATDDAPTGGDGGAGEILKTLQVASQIVDAVRFDGDMNYPMAGNGGLLSEGTIRKADELHKLLIKIGVRTA